MKSYLVTGGAGFIGSHIAEELAKRGHRVRVVDNFLTGKRENIRSFEDKIDFIMGDIRDFATCRKTLEGVDCVLHQAALPSVPRSIEDPRLTNEININGTLNLLLASVEAGVKRFVFASSSSVYGDDPALPKREGHEGAPLSPYAISKICGEKYCQVFHRIYKLSSVCLRYFNIFGPRQDPYSQYAAVIPNFILKSLNGENPTIYGDGEQSRDFTYVANVVEANILASGIEDVADGIFNIACGENTTVNALCSKIGAVTGQDVKPVHDSPRPGDVRHSYADISKAREVLGYEPSFSFEEGLRMTVEFFRKGE